MEAIRVLLSDDHKIVRAGVRQILEQIPGVEVVAETDTGHTTLRAIEKYRPRVVFLDLNLPDLSGLDVLKQVQHTTPEVRVIILSIGAEGEVVDEAFRRGAAGYLLKDAGADELARALRDVLAGETYASPSVTRHLLKHMQRSQERTATLGKLTPRQQEVLELIALGLSNKEIAGKLHLSPKTVETHRQQLMERLDIHDVAGLTRFAMEMGLIQSNARTGRREIQGDNRSADW